ncbi:MAG: F0F1 ATP synthase subunit B [Candidatus Hydrogenedentota bacterium]
MHTLSLIASALTAAAEAAAEAAEGAHGADALLAPDPTLTIATWVTFFLFVILIGKFGWGPLVAALDAREKSISDNLQRAESGRREAEQLLATYQKKLEEAKGEADALIVAARTRSEEVVQKMTTEAKHQATAIAQKAQESIEAERLRAVTELRTIVAEASVSLAGKILQEELTPARHTRLIDSVVAGIATKR